MVHCLKASTTRLGQLANDKLTLVSEAARKTRPTPILNNLVGSNSNHRPIQMQRQQQQDYQVAMW